MISRVESFGGLWKGKGVIKVRLGKPSDDRLIVSIKQVSRDNREKVDGKPNPRFGKVVYETVKSIDVFDATPQQVEKIVFDGLSAKSEK